MSIQQGVQTTLRFKKETTFGTKPAAGSAQVLRRVTHGINMTKAIYSSNEIRQSQQRFDMRHGRRSVAGPINGELSPGTYAPLLGSLMRKDFVAQGTTTGANVTIAGAGPTYTVTRGAGSWIADGFREGMVMKLTSGVTGANLNRNLLILTLTATVATVVSGDGVALSAEGPVSSNATATGKISNVPATAHTSDSYTFEDWNPTISVSECYVGCRIAQGNIRVPATGLSTIDLSVMGQDIDTDGAEYFTTPTVETSTGIAAAANGIVVINGVQQAALTALDLTINANMSDGDTVGANITPDVFEGRVLVSGTFSAFFESGTLRDLFINETECPIFIYLPVSSAAAAGFLAVQLPRVKLGSASLDDGEKGRVRTYSFEALENPNGASEEVVSTIQIQDSDAP